MKLRHLFIFTIGLISLSACQKAAQPSPIGSSNERFILLDADVNYNLGKSTKPGFTSIVRTNLDGTNLTTLSTPPTGYYDAQPKVSVDNTKIIFYRFQLGTGNNSICTENADGTNFTQIITGTASYGSPSFSPDGARVIYTKSAVVNGITGSDVYIAKADGTSETRITFVSNTANQTVTNVYWAVTGKIYFNTTSGFYAVNSDGSGLATINAKAYAHIKSVSNDGAFVLNSSDGINLFVSAADGTGARNITNITSAALSILNATFIKDNSQVYYTAKDANSTGYAIFMVNADGTGLTKIINGYFENPCVY